MAEQRTSHRRTASRQKSTTPQPERKPRTRALRSASREVEDKAGVPSMADDSRLEAPKTRRKTAKDAPDLTTVDEVDTQLVLDDAPGTPTQPEPVNPMPFRSPGAASEMSGTTAISSFSMVEAEFLEPKYVLKHLRKLCDSAEEFLHHLAPSDAKNAMDLHETDRRNINDIQQPDSEFSEDYRDFDAELNVHLTHYKSEEQNYIHVRAIHRALFGSNGDETAAQSGLDLILYLTNLLVFTKQMIHSDRTEKHVWDVLRQLDNSFPTHFMRSLVPEDQSAIPGDSSLLDETYELALDLRTQLAILVLQRGFNENELNSDVLLTDVFFREDATQEEGSTSLRGWSFSHEKDREPILPPNMHDPVVRRIQELREFFPVEEDESQTSRDSARLDDLANQYPWTATVMRILHWARCRRLELHTAIEEAGGPIAIANNVKKAMAEPQPLVQPTRTASLTRASPRRKQTSFGRDRRRSSRKFDPNAPVDLRAIEALKAREREARVEVESTQQQQEHVAPQAGEEPQNNPSAIQDQQDDWQPTLEDGQEQVEKPQSDEVNEQAEDEEPSGPPTNSADLLKALKAVSNPQKENRPVSIFDRQTGATRVEFGDGFDETQPTPGPSNRSKGKQPVQPSPRKRSRQVESDDESDDDAFEAEERGDRVQEQRRKAPVAKKVRIDPSSSSAPPSHQPPPRNNMDDDDYTPQQHEQDGSLSEHEAPDMTEEAPPSSYQSQHRLALQNSGALRSSNSRKPRTAWSVREEEAFIQYMGLFPAKYATILQHDQTQIRPALQNRTQVNLKDKARTMAINMIKSGTGFLAGFEEIIKPTTKDGRALIDSGFEW